MRVLKRDICKWAIFSTVLLEMLGSGIGVLHQWSPKFNVHPNPGKRVTMQVLIQQVWCGAETVSQKLPGDAETVDWGGNWGGALHLSDQEGSLRLERRNSKIRSSEGGRDSSGSRKAIWALCLGAHTPTPGLTPGSGARSAAVSAPPETRAFPSPWRAPSPRFWRTHATRARSDCTCDPSRNSSRAAAARDFQTQSRGWNSQSAHSAACRAQSAPREDSASGAWACSNLAFPSELWGRWVGRV